ncbi:probable G-protein coupled receptor 179 [Heliangelus exortis]|uniref:probable G-protein coupled receptor 179 n=1 Tax=Heliangelus exortis TaxID=472823 RepID=UPI003A8FAE18
MGGPERWSLLWLLQTALIRGIVLTGGQSPQRGPPELGGWSPTPSSSWAPTAEPGAPGDPEGSAAALAFLQTGDARQLARANCSRGVTAGAPGPAPPPGLRATLRAAPEALSQAANFLNMLFQTNDIREASVAEDVEWYQALVRSLVEGHPWVRRAVLALDAHPLAPKPRLMLQATKRDGEIFLQDVSTSAPSLGNLSWDNEWFNAPKSQRNPPLRKRLLSNDLRTMETPKWQRGDSYVGDSGHVRWSPPFLECREGRFLPAWAVTLSSAFYGLKPDLSPEFKGVLRVDIDLQDVTIDQCASGPGWFTNTHLCDLNSTQCVPQESSGFVLGKYLCRCKPGFYGAGGVASGARAGVVGADGGSRLACWPCHQGCATCEDDKPCLIQEDGVLRAAVLSCQASCMLAVFLSMLVSYHFRRSKRIRSSGVILLETILFGSLLLYFPVFILYFKPSIFRCIVLRWVRMLGFAIVYGTITLKLYRVLKVFLSRTARRVPYVSSGRVLKMLGLILLLVLWFLAAWTIGMLENIEKNIPLVIRTQTARGLHFYICGHDRWDYMMVIAEMLFLLWGSFLCYATRAVPSAFHEPRYMGIALHNELMISSAFHVARFIMVPSLHPDWTLLLFFAHTHSTITMTLVLLFIPKFLHAGSPLREEIAAEVYEDEVDMRRSGSCLTSSIASAWSERSLDPDDIREELKKLYGQLEALRTRRMAANNPHLPKKRSPRRSLARSTLRRSSGGGERGAGTPARRSSSARRVPNATLRKSRSTEGPPRGSRGGPPSPASPVPGRKMTVRMASEQSDSESLDAAPLICKSASAQNLLGPGQPPQPHAAPLQKSLSVVAGPRDEALLAASRAGWEEQHSTQHPATPSLGHPRGQGPPEQATMPQSPHEADAIPPAGSIPAEGSPQEDTSPLGDGKVQKNVTHGPIKSVSVDSSLLPGRVRVAVKRTPPPPPIRCQSLGHRATAAGDSPEPPLELPAEDGKLEGTVGGDPGQEPPPGRKGRLLPTPSIPAHVCPWELIQDEILSRKQKSTEAAEPGSPGDTEVTPPSLKPPPQPTSLKGLGLALKAFNRARGKSILRGKREGEGSLGKREQDGGSRRERSSLVGTSGVSLGGIGQGSATKSPEWSRQRPGSEPTTHPGQGDTGPCQHNNNAGTSGEAAGWGDSGAEGEGDRTAPGTEGLAEEPGSPQGAGDASSGGDEIPPGSGHQGGAGGPCDSPAVASSGKAEVWPQQRDVVAVGEVGKDAPVATMEDGVADGLKGDRSSIPLLPPPPPDPAVVQQPHREPTLGSSHPPTAGVQRVGAEELGAEELGAEVCPQGASISPAGKGALLRQEAVASREDTWVPGSQESLGKVLEKSRSQPEPLGPGGSWGAGMVPPRSHSLGMALGKGGSEGEPLDPQEKLGVEKPPGNLPELPKGALGKVSSMEGRRDEVCPWESGEGERKMRAEICPWDVEGAQPEEEKQEGGRRQLEKRTPPKSGGAVGGQESRSSLQAPRPPPKPAPKSSELPEVTSRSPTSTRASVCPWEAAGADSDAAAEVCPWERGTASSDAEKMGDGEIPPVKNGISLQRASPRARAGTREGESGQKGPPSRGLMAKPPSLPTTSWKQGGTTESRKADVCPWEVEGEPVPKSEICPWEEPTAPSGKERPSQDTPGASKGESKARSGGLEDIKAKLAEHRDTGTSPELSRKSLECSKAKPKKSLTVESIKEEICPWESLGTEQPPEQPRARSPELPKSPSRKSQSVESLKAEVCPWEAPEPETTAKAEICPWEVAAPPSGKEKPRQDKGALSIVSRSPSTGPGLLKETRDIRTAKKEKASSDLESICPWESTEGTSPGYSTRSTELLKATSKKSESTGSMKEEICPWESLGTEQPPEQPRARSPELPKSPSRKSQSVESLKAEVCPWEAPEPEATAKAEICPWEVAAAPSDQPKGSPGGVSKGDKHIPPQAGLGSKMRSLGKGSGEREAVCPWESTEQPPEQPRARSPELPKSPSRKSQSVESLKAEVCPWEVPEPEATAKAEICPWEVAAPPSGKEKPRQDKGALSIVSRNLSTTQAKGERESICPWESLDTEQPPAKLSTGSPELPKSLSKKSQSVESLKAEVCPWEAPEPETTAKAEICPWEVAAPPSGKEKPRQDKGALSIVSKSPSTGPGLLKETRDIRTAKKEKASSDLESICPWESTEGTSPGYSTRSTELLKATSKKSESTGSMKEEICPWESLGMEQPPEEPRARSPELPKSPSRKSQSVESLKAEVCPWEVPEPEATAKAEICPWEVAAPPSGKEKPRQDKGALSIVSRSPSTGPGLPKEVAESTTAKKEKGKAERESICPWESLDMEQPPKEPCARSPELPKSPSRKSQSVESLKAEVCPWEVPEPETTAKAEICPWEVAAAPSDQPKGSPGGVSKGDKHIPPQAGLGSKMRSLGKGSGEQEAVCPWESTEQPPEQPRARSPELPKSPSRKSQSVESLKAEVCPWEVPDPEATAKAEICPWEVAAAPQEEGAAPGQVKLPPKKEGGAPKSEEKGSSEREAICPWESLGTEEPSLKTAAGAEPSQKSGNAEGWNDAVCPWEAAEPSSSGKENSRAPPGVGKSKLVAVSAIALLKKPKGRSGDKAEHKALHRTGPGIRPPRGSRNLPGTIPGTGGAEVCPWEAGEEPPSPDESSTEPRKASEVCPWEEESPEPTLGGESGASRSSGDGDKDGREPKPEVCPWDHQ